MSQLILKAKLKIKKLDRLIQEDIAYFGSVSAWCMDLIIERDKAWRFLYKNDKKWIEEKYDSDNYKKIRIF